MQMNISKDGKTLTGTAKGADAQGKPFEYLVFYEKQYAGAKPKAK